MRNVKMLFWNTYVNLCMKNSKKWKPFLEQLKRLINISATIIIESSFSTCNLYFVISVIRFQKQSQKTGNMWQVSSGGPAVDLLR